MDTMLLIDKPSGITSFDVIRRLRTSPLVRGARKIGHAGTLDPLATGLLIIGLNKGTKDLPNYTNLPKEYEVLIEFGKTSTTYDADGEVSDVIANDSVIASAAKQSTFEEALKKFTGKIQQVPPAFSAKRIKGERAYDFLPADLRREIDSVLTGESQGAGDFAAFAPVAEHRSRRDCVTLPFEALRAALAG